MLDRDYNKNIHGITQYHTFGTNTQKNDDSYFTQLCSSISNIFCCCCTVKEEENLELYQRNLYQDRVKKYTEQRDAVSKTLKNIYDERHERSQYTSSIQKYVNVDGYRILNKYKENGKVSNDEYHKLWDSFSEHRKYSYNPLTSASDWWNSISQQLLLWWNINRG